MRLITPLLLIAALLSVATHADAEVQPPLTYRAKTATIQGESSGKAVTVKCPKGTKVAGGGSQIEDRSLAVKILGSHPIDGRDRDRKPDDGWRTVGANEYQEPKELSVWVVCAESGRYRYVRSTAEVPVNGRASATVSCRRDEQVSGGGGLMLSNHRFVHLTASHPGDDTSDIDPDVDNLWSVRGQNSTTKVQKLRAWVICASQGTFSYPSTQASVGSGATSIQSVDCAGLSQVTGGGITAFDDAALFLNATRPHTVDADGIVDDGWTAAASNAGPPETVFVAAICLEPPA